jgi:hypothetical protein
MSEGGGVTPDIHNESASKLETSATIHSANGSLHGLWTLSLGVHSRLLMVFSTDCSTSSLPPLAPLYLGVFF